MGGGNKTARVHRLALALYLMGAGTVALQQAARDSAPPITPVSWLLFGVGTVCGVYFWACAAYHACGWGRAMWLGWRA